MNPEWSIQSRGDKCASTGEPFKEEEYFYTLLFDEVAGFRREDWSEIAFKARGGDAPKPFSFWRTKYEPPAPGAPEAVTKQTAEDLLRRYVEEGDPQYANACYILALMLERKRLLKERETKNDDQLRLLRIYEHVKTGEIFVIQDPQLRLDQIAAVQEAIAAQLAPSQPVAAPAPKEPAQTEPAQTEPAQTEPAQTEPAQTEPAQTEPAQTEPAQTEGVSP